MLARQGFVDLVGVDMSSDSLRALEQHVQARAVCLDALEFLRRCQGQTFDFVSALNFLEHLNKDSLADVLREIRRVLKPQGQLVAMVPNALSPFGNLTRYWDISHELAFTPNNFRQLAQLTQYDGDLEFRECGPLVHGWKSGLRWVAWRGIHWAIAAWMLVELGSTRDQVYTMDMLVRLCVR